MNANDLADIRRDYALKELSESTVDADPFAQFAAWMKDAIDGAVNEATAMTLSTVGDDGCPSSRVVLLKGFDENGLVFYTNYESQKGRELERDSHCSLHFFWSQLERQINVKGIAAKVSAEESETYFRTRPFDSRIGAWASKQSEKLASRDELEQRAGQLTEKYSDGDVPLPPFWGGYRVTPVRFEFWQGRPSRLHDRILYERIDNKWVISRLSP